MYRTHYAAALRRADVSQAVTLSGWVARIRDHGGVAFVDLRDSSGVAQVTFHDEQIATAETLRVESCVTITGIVRERPAGNVNEAISSGEVEVEATSLTVLAPCDVLPFPLDDEPGEEIRLAYRYLDLRRDAAAQPLKLRSKVSAAVRAALLERDFVEIETPTLTRSTPEGARDFLVPARLKAGAFYALPQSPQLFKQLLMVAGFERYFQIARCYRDEDFRADRQPEFTQLDIEMSFVEQDDVIALSEHVLSAMWGTIGVELETPLPRMTYAEAMRRFGTDKPDLRFGLELVECTDYFAGGRVRDLPGAVRRRGRDAGRRRAAAPRARRVAGVGPAARREGARVRARRRGRRAARPGREEPVRGRARGPGCRMWARRPGDCIFFAAGPPQARAGAAGRAPRRDRPCALELIDESAWAFTWIVDAPLFEPTGRLRDDDVAVGSGAWTAVHHAFTAPRAEDLDSFESDPGAALSYAYDIVCNGNEIGGGCIRIHRASCRSGSFR